MKSVFFLSLLLLISPVYAETICEPQVAGAFYPGNPDILTRTVDGFLQNAAPVPVPGRIIALISPHAGYTYSGQIAANGYKLIKGKPYTTVVVLGTGHRYASKGISVYRRGKMRTPLGDVEIDEEFVEKLLGENPRITFESRAFEGEHSVEVQIPFLQRTLSNFKIVPVILGDCDSELCAAFARLLTDATGTRTDVLIIASTDLYHGYSPDEADAFDARTLAAIKNMDAQGLYDGLRNQSMQACGGFGITIALMAAKSLGADSLSLLARANSAEVTGKRIHGKWTVGYASAAVYTLKKEEPAPAAQPVAALEKKRGQHAQS